MVPIRKKTLTKHIADYIKKNPPGHNCDWQTDTPVFTLQGSRYVLAPVWFVYYSYNSERYYFIMDGTGKKESITLPVNKEEKKYVSTLRGWGIGLALVCAAVCFFVPTGNFFTWLLLVILPAIAIYIAFDFPAERRLGKSKALREAGAKKLLGE